MTQHLWWYLSRGAGITSWLCGALTLSIGLSLSSKATINPKPAWQLAVHRHLAMLTLSSLAVHVVAIVFDGYTNFGVADVLVPFHSEWKRVAVASGVVSMWILATVEMTSLLRNRMPKQMWRVVHRMSLLAYVLSSVHFLQAGSERNIPAIKLAVIVITGLNLTLLAFRVLADNRTRLVTPATMAK
jgi:DMSO/TMAO reductase YedYZ heme-binding membrane subunit